MLAVDIPLTSPSPSLAPSHHPQARIRIKARSSKSWALEASCRPHPDASPAAIRAQSNLFHPTRDTPISQVDQAKDICGSCPVRIDCLAWAVTNMNTREWHGVWGGVTEKEARATRKEVVRLSVPDDHLNAFLSQRHPHPNTEATRRDGRGRQGVTSSSGVTVTTYFNPSAITTKESR